MANGKPGPHEKGSPRVEVWNAARAARSMIENHGKRALAVAEQRAATAKDEEAANKWRVIADAIRRRT